MADGKPPASIVDVNFYVSTSALSVPRVSAVFNLALVRFHEAFLSRLMTGPIAHLKHSPQLQVVKRRDLGESEGCCCLEQCYVST